MIADEIWILTAFSVVPQNFLILRGLHIAVSIILADIVVKLSSVQKSGELGKNVFVLEHNSHLNLTAKLRIQVRFIPKHHLIDCISINSKSCQSTLTGQ